ncbi:unnamed protein product [Clonostachys rosea]|uniref:Uncharacterized protein n=1 Tax=Bionectria ochroleuca TaxID=29856 RepID=A0ABY6V184_BIOOC|nr:unnamed protein product [Clonostachys rosea]
MCGPETTNRPRGGALAALSPPSTPVSHLRSTLCGDLAFHTPGNPGSTNATHARLTPEEVCHHTALSDLCVVIHSSGDLTRNATDCGLLHQFTIPAKLTSQNGEFYELALDSPLSLAVGNDGIIGRRVSLCSGSRLDRDNIVAEGIVGFNFMRPVQPTL